MYRLLRDRRGNRVGRGLVMASCLQVRRARLVADGGGLENRCGSDVTVGSNPTPSALTRALTIEDPRWRTFVLDTTGKTVGQSADVLEAWVRDERALLQDGGSPLSRGWTT